jgi:hypothetical protein
VGPRKVLDWPHARCFVVKEAYKSRHGIENRCSVSYVVLEHYGEVGTNVNVSDGVLRLRVLLLTVPHALSNIDSLAVRRNVLAHFQTEGLAGPKSAASYKRKQNAVATCGP